MADTNVEKTMDAAARSLSDPIWDERTKMAGEVGKEKKIIPTLNAFP